MIGDDLSEIVREQEHIARIHAREGKQSIKDPVLGLVVIVLGVLVSLYTIFVG